MPKSFNMKLVDRDLETIPAKVCRILRNAIIKGELKPGERLVQDELAQTIGVSRMPVREAIRQLETEGLVIIEPHRGAVVKSFSKEDVEEIYLLRSAFEKFAVKESLKHITDETINELEELINIMDNISNVDKFVEHNIKFHKLLIKHCPWDRLNSFIQGLWSGFPLQTPHMLTDQIELSNKEHKEMLDAIRNKSYDLVCDLVEKHISRTGKSIIESINEK